MPLDGTESTLDNFYKIVGTIKNSPMPKEKVPLALIAFAVYLGDIMKKNIPGSEYVVTMDNTGVHEISLKNAKGEASLLSWVKKCYESPEENNIVEKYKWALSWLQE
jgi:hypothetical protein